MRWTVSSCFVAVTFAGAALAADLPGSSQTNVEVGAAATVDALRSDHPQVRYHHDHGRISRIYGPAFGFGDSAEATAAGFVERYAGVLGADSKDLQPRAWFREGPNTQPVMPDRENGGYKFTLVYYSQERDGVPVFRAEARLLVRNEPGNPLVLVVSNLWDLGDFHVTAPASNAISETAIAGVLAMNPDMVSFTQPEAVIFAGYDALKMTPRLAVSFIADNGLLGTPDFNQRLFVADAATHEILYHESMILDVDVTGSVRGMATTGWGADACGGELSTGLPYARVEISGGNSAFADVNGNFTIPNPGSGSVTVNAPMSGQWFVINDEAGPESFLTANVTPPGPVNFVHSAPNTSALERAQVNAYLHANIVRDLAIGANPAYPDLGNVMQVYVNLASTCNAFYDPAIQTINFYAAGGGCNNTAFSTVVHHEYGHHLVARGGSGQGAYGEGTGDCVGVIISDTSPLGVGFQTCANGIRNADNNCDYVTSGCSTCGSAIHTCGQLISGCVWETRNELVVSDPGTYRTILADLCINAILLHTGTSITPQITIDWLTLDDNDANINNGTPHYNQINTGFTEHNMPAPPLDLLTFSFPDGQPASVSPAGGTRMRVVVTGISGTPQPGTGMLHYSTGGPYTAIAMDVISPNVYDAVFPASACGTTLRYYVSAQTTSSVTETDPGNAPTGFVTTVSTYALNVVFADGFASNLGWTVANTAVTDGAWARGAPLGGNNGGRGDPADDYDGDNSAMVTGNGNNQDLDGGPTRVTSPVLDLSAPGFTYRLTYARWFSNDDLDIDRLVVELSNNNGSSWVNVETVAGTAGWVLREIDVATYVAPTAQVRLRFTATDNPNDSVTEGAVDAVRVVGLNCTAPGFAEGDANCDGVVDFFDIDPFLMAIFDPATYATTFCGGDFDTTDVNDSGAVDFFDIDPFLAILFP